MKDVVSCPHTRVHFYKMFCSHGTEAVLANFRCILKPFFKCFTGHQHQVPSKHSKHWHTHPLCKGTTGCSHWLWFVTGHSMFVLINVDGASVKSICFWPWLANWREPMEWGLIWCQTESLDEVPYKDLARVCVYWILYYVTAANN